MSLAALPDDALARVCGYLHASDRAALGRTCSPLARALAAGNSPLWQDVHRHKYGASVPPARSFRALQVREAADAHLCYTGAWTAVLREPAHAPVAAYDAASGALFAAAGRRLVRVPPPLTNARRGAGASEWTRHGGHASAIAAHDGAVAVAWNRAVSVRAGAGAGGRRVRTLRGHAGAVRAAAFLRGGHVLACGGDDGAVRLHAVGARRACGGALRAHGGAVRFLAEGGPRAGPGAALLVAARDRAKTWDVDALRCTRTYPGRRFARADGGRALFAVVPAGAPAVRLYDARAPAAVAFLSLPREWRARPIHALAECDGALAAGVGSAGVAVWRARGPREAQALGDPDRFSAGGAAALRCVLLRDGVAYAAGGAGKLLTFAYGAGRAETVVEDPHGCGGAYSQLLDAGERRIAATREEGVVLFDPAKRGAVMLGDDARRAAGLDPLAQGGVQGTDQFLYSRFWESAGAFGD